jgi:hypothetical protein
MNYGTRVSANFILKKNKKLVFGIKGPGLTAPIACITTWEEKKRQINNGIFLGIRVLPTGITKRGKFIPKSYKKVALVSPNSRTNPVYVDLKDLRVSYYE